MYVITLVSLFYFLGAVRAIATIFAAVALLVIAPAVSLLLSASQSESRRPQNWELTREGKLGIMIRTYLTWEEKP